MRSLIAILIVGVLSACSPARFSVSQVEDKGKQIIVIKDEDTKTGFLETIQNWLTTNGYSFSVVAQNTPSTPDTLTLKYEGFWKWDLALYFKRGYIWAYEGDQQVGQVAYEVPYTAHASKFASARHRIETMLGLLFGKLDVDEENMKLSEEAKSKNDTEQR